MLADRATLDELMPRHVDGIIVHVNASNDHLVEAALPLIAQLSPERVAEMRANIVEAMPQLMYPQHELEWYDDAMSAALRRIADRAGVGV